MKPSLNLAIFLSLIATAAEPPITGEKLARWRMSTNPTDVQKAVQWIENALSANADPVAVQAVRESFLVRATTTNGADPALSSENIAVLIRAAARFGEPAHHSLYQTSVLELYLESDFLNPFIEKDSALPEKIAQVLLQDLTSNSLSPSQRMGLQQIRSRFQERLRTKKKRLLFGDHKVEGPALTKLLEKIAPGHPEQMKAAINLLQEDSQSLVYQSRPIFESLANAQEGSELKQVRDALLGGPAFAEWVQREMVSPYRSSVQERLGNQATQTLTRILGYSQLDHALALADIYNAAIHHSTRSLEWGIPAALLHLNGHPMGRSTWNNISATASRRLEWQSMRDRIDWNGIDSKVREIAFVYQSLEEVLDQLTDPKSPYFDREDLLRLYLQFDFGNTSFVTRSEIFYPKEIFLRDKHKEGIPLPPKIARWVGAPRLNYEAWSALEKRESPQAIFDHLIRQKTKLNSAQIRDAFLSRSSILRQSLAFHGQVNDPSLYSEFEILEELIVGLEIDAIGRGIPPSQRTQVIADQIAPLFLDNSFWKIHPEWIKPGQSRVDPQYVINQILTRKLSHINPHAPENVQQTCLGKWLKK